jgi:hypothetical protein
MVRSGAGKVAQRAQPPATTHTEVEIAAALPFVRQAARLMEVAFLDTGLHANPFHQKYVGWMNLFGRWASSPLFRTWWPWLVPLHAGSFLEFMHQRFALPVAVDRTRFSVTPATPGGYAWERWASERGVPPPAGSPKVTVWGGLLTGVEPPLQAALVAVEEVSREERRWEARNFYVAPGLWGVGLGELFLGRLVTTLTASGASRIVVTCGVAPSPSEVALYPSSGFRWKRNGGEISFLYS